MSGYISLFVALAGLVLWALNTPSPKKPMIAEVGKWLFVVAALAFLLFIGGKEASLFPK